MIEYTVVVEDNGDKRWYIDDKRHREDGPAIECANGDKFWYIDDKRHREDGPAIECTTGDKRWYINDKLHREDGPAIEYANGDKFWYIDGKKLSEIEFKVIENMINLVYTEIKSASNDKDIGEHAYKILKQAAIDAIELQRKIELARGWEQVK